MFMKEVWEEFMQAVSESEKGMPKLVSLHLDETGAGSAGGAIVRALSSGKLPSLKYVSRHHHHQPYVLLFDLDISQEEALRSFADAVRAGSFPSGLQS
mmetsp:Transcript_41622/g.82123  ORF Transcript_41622/g.82123 Transcript_41622/m.82123 type:complete len:98 (+) Transcript_41622:1663-1956(+)